MKGTIDYNILKGKTFDSCISAKIGFMCANYIYRVCDGSVKMRIFVKLLLCCNEKFNQYHLSIN